jgi:hypothetical protein
MYSKAGILVSARTLFGAGLAIIAIISLATVLAVQQIALQRISGHTEYITQQQYLTQYVTMIQEVTQTVQQTVTQQITKQQTETSSIPAGGPYVLITYSAQTADSVTVPAAGVVYTPHISGYVYLVLSVKVENHGYSQVYLSLSDFYVIIGSQQYAYADYIAYTYTWLPNGDVFNGLSVTGNLVYEVPPSYGTFVLFWNHPSDVNVQYIQQ